MTTRPASCRCGQLPATVNGGPVREQRKHRWVEVLVDRVELLD